MTEEKKPEIPKSEAGIIKRPSLLTSLKGIIRELLQGSEVEVNVKNENVDAGFKVDNEKIDLKINSRLKRKPGSQANHDNQVS
jgi:hypothetical protein